MAARLKQTMLCRFAASDAQLETIVMVCKKIVLYFSRAQV